MNELPNELRETWSDTQASNQSIRSPFFRPEFFDIVSMFRDDVCIAILEQDAAIGFFPFQHGPRKSAKPVGSPLSDFQGLISPNATKWNIADVLRSCGLKSWRFDHALADQIEISDHQCTVEPSPYIDLSEGFDAYDSNRPNRGAKSFSNLRRAMRSASKTIGELSFEFDAKDKKVFEQIIAWKRQQYASASSLDPFDFPWSIRTLEELVSRNDDTLRGVVSALYFGKRLAAAHLGMRSARTLHYWFPAYDPALAEYSPGMICLLEIAKQAGHHSIARIDLGKGDETYKRRLLSGVTEVAAGSITTQRSGWAVKYAKRGLESASRVPVLGAPLRELAGLYRKINRGRRYG
jgi:CelD/BcsL family acetyltransferase involved in cellulose biosynthesis